MDEDRMTNEIARILLHTITGRDPPKNDSDHSYVMSLCSKQHRDGEFSTYMYPDNLPPGDIFVDRVGWMSCEEVARYLMMGYRVWDENGRRLHFHGTPLDYNSLNVFRLPRKIVCSQDVSEVPDLQVQLEARSFNGSTGADAVHEVHRTPSTGRIMPWDLRLSAPDVDQEGLSILTRVKLAFIASRAPVAAPCYGQHECLSFEPYGGMKLGSSPLKTVKYPEEIERIVGTYPQIGVDVPYLSIKYPPTQVSLRPVDSTDVHSMQPNHAGKALCDICRALDLKEMFEWGTVDIELDLGLMHDLLTKTSCSFCRIVAVLCKDGFDSLKRSSLNPDPDAARESGFDIQQPIEVTVVRNPILTQSTKPLVILKQHFRTEYYGPIVSLWTVRGDIRGRYTLNTRQYVDFQLVRKMVDRCTSEHGSACGQKSRGLPESMELVVVDVIQICLVTVDGSEVDFITLSYVWGTGPMVKTTKQTFGHFQKPRSLVEAGVSRVIQDAAAVVQGLGKGYLWVDALCIIQDDEEHRLSQIRRMADIYGQSWLTIVALAGENSSSPLPGVSYPRPQLVEVVQGMPITGILSRLSSNAHNQIYERRAWTFQERLISRRCLYIGEHQVYLDCGHGETNDHEQILPPMDRYRWLLAAEFNSLNLIVKHMDKLNISGFHQTESFCTDQLQRYSKIMSQYSTRELSFPSDIENAFLGIQDVLSHKLGWGFLAGLPTGVFDWALLWLPHGQLQRRRWHKHGDGSTVVSPPSWSWFGWLGKVSYAAYTYHSKLAFTSIRPRILAFTIEADGKSFPIHRQPSAIWHTDTLEQVTNSLENPSTYPTGSLTYPDTAFPRQHFPYTIILQFEAEAVLYKAYKLEIEWMTTGPDAGHLKQSLRHGYSRIISDMAAQIDDNSLDLIAMAVCDVITHSMRGGQFAEEKTWDSKDKLVVMLIRWKGQLAERLAVGYMDPKRWQEISPVKKSIRLC
ncbi:hypothetical protein EPUS_07809 [Endocarpon pusillum Z07020]|uniref:Heterokaryon incompatibility domain-containing protein n=1 Tax=Endocarpon pusillum (strain Z07020 / HMAS-L-300199) TaxID=1263415 RepID=U1HWI7_ENDPU|nr:uncharacterized protein EPUS_07809 [Endocarpon pusillum Z07020]ERF75120.1 hypothetical protein EPUS_07809 [Endocarpon pusillum Z07020]